MNIFIDLRLITLYNTVLSMEQYIPYLEVTVNSFEVKDQCVPCDKVKGHLGRNN